MESKQDWHFAFEAYGHSDPDIDDALAENPLVIVVSSRASCATEAGDRAWDRAWDLAESQHGHGVEIREIV